MVHPDEMIMSTGKSTCHDIKRKLTLPVVYVN